MNYPAAITDFFKSPKWVMNLLFSGLCVIVILVGWVALIGWHVTGFWGRTDERPETFPPFDTQKLGKYFERGLWPLLAALVVGVGTSIVQFMIGIVPKMILGKVMGGLLMMPVSLAIGVASFCITVPVVIRAILTQDFQKSFDVPFIKHFVTLMWKETLISAIFLMAASFGLMLVGAIALCVGIPFGLGIAFFASSGIYRQLYLLYLSRGGMAVPASPTLSDDAVSTLPPV